MSRPEGWFSEADAAPYVRAAQTLNPGGVLVEIGSYKGRSASWVAPIVKERGARMFVVDPFIGVRNPNQGLIASRKALRAEFEKNMNAIGVMDCITIIEAGSIPGCDYFEHNSIDVCYIDGLHDYGNVMVDIAVWLPRVRSGGYLMGHDYSFGPGGHPGVRQAVDQWFSKPDEVTGQTWVRRKMPKAIGIETCAHCNRACSFCPTNNTVKHAAEFMDRDLHDKIIDDMVSWGFHGCVEYQLHNEPLLDKRLEALIAYARHQLPHNGIVTSTNGDKLDRERVDSLFEAGLTSMLINVYDDKHYERLVELTNELEAEPQYSIHRFGQASGFYPMRSDKGLRTISLYDARNISKSTSGYTNRAGNNPNDLPVLQPLKKNCTRPFNNMSIKYNGNAVLCCQDWKQEEVIGNCATKTIADIYAATHVAYYQRRLANHHREGLNLCEKCDW